jgi:hypothetical protein
MPSTVFLSARNPASFHITTGFRHGRTRISSKPKEVIRRLTPGYVGITSSIGAADDRSDGPRGNVGADVPQCHNGNGMVTPSIYGQSLPATHSDYFILNHQGYFVPQEAGTYTFSARGDDNIQLWLGAKAVSAWSRDNADWQADAISMYAGVQTFQYTVTQAGAYIPFRVVFVNAQGCARFYLSITSPSGQTVLGPSTTYAESGPSFVRSCDGAAAVPPLPSFS